MRVAVLEIMPSNHCDQLALRIGVAVDVPLGRLDRPVTGEQLDIAQRATGLVHQPRRPGDERPASGMGRAAVQTDVAECAVEPDHDTQRRHRPAALGSDDRSAAGRETAIGGEGLAKIGVHRDQSAAAVLGRDIAQLDHRTDVAGRIEDHVPGQVGDLTGPQASLGGQQHDHTVAEGMSGAAGKNQEVVDVANERVFLPVCQPQQVIKLIIVCIAKKLRANNDSYEIISIQNTDKERPISLSVWKRSAILLRHGCVDENVEQTDDTEDVRAAAH